MEESRRESFFRRIKNTKGYGILATFIKSAAVGLLFAVLCFVYDVYHDSAQDKQLEESVAKLRDTQEQLGRIEQNLTTRYLGIFPGYISEIGQLFDNLDPTDTIVIFEDVLYYGIKSRPKEFYSMNKKLFGHALNQGSTTVAYYNTASEERAWNDIFHKVIVESRIDSKYHAVLYASRDKELEMLRNTNQMRRGAWKSVDSTWCEKYFSATKEDDFEKFKKDVNAYLSKDLLTEGLSDSSRSGQIAYQMCVEIDSVKRHYLDKALDKITFYDYEQMYRMMSEVIVRYYNRYGIQLIPLDEYLTMSCWMVRRGRDVETVLAFPSKYSTDEIGFRSQDEAFSTYISTMLNGVRQNRRTNQVE